MDAECRPCTVDTSRNWKSFTSGMFAIYLESCCKMALPTLKFWTVWTQSALNPFSSSLMSFAWRCITFLDGCCTESYYIAKDIKADQRNGSKTQLNLTSLGTKSDQSSWRSVLLTGCIGRPLPIKTLHTLKKTGILNSFPKKNNATVALHINTNIQCPHCSRLCMHKLGLQNHGWIAKQSLLWTQ